MYAEGLSFFGNKLSEERKLKMLDQLGNKATQEGVAHGTAMLLGLSHAFSNDSLIAEKLMIHLYGEKANIGEACGYALGLIKATHFDKDIVDIMINTSRNNQHDRIARSMMCSLGLMAFGNSNKVLSYFDSLIQEKDSLLRMGAVFMLSMAFFDSNNNDIVSKLLQIAATDLSNDVRRASVIGLSFVMLSKRKKAFVLLKMLSKSYNSFVRHGVALALGIMGAHSFDKQFHNLLMELWKDKVFHVKQAVSIAFGLIHQLGTKYLDSNLMTVRKEMKDKIDTKYESGVTKLGSYLGFGLLNPGGGNCRFTLKSSSGHLKMKNIVGSYMFTFYWYWMPLVNMIGLSLGPSYLVGTLSSLNIPRGFQFKSKAPQKVYQYYKTKREVETEKKLGLVVLSTTQKTRARKDIDI